MCHCPPQGIKVPQWGREEASSLWRGCCALPRVLSVGAASAELSRLISAGCFQHPLDDVFLSAAVHCFYFACCIFNKLTHRPDYLQTRQNTGLMDLNLDCQWELKYYVISPSLLSLRLNKSLSREMLIVTFGILEQED